MSRPNQWNQPVTRVMRLDVTRLNQDLTVEQSLNQIRTEGLGEKIVYFYVVDEQDRLVGVLPTRRLLTAPPNAKLKDIMQQKVVAIPHTATLIEACEQFLLFKFLAFPIVDEDRRLLGVIDVTVFTQEVLDLAQKEQMESVFELIGFRITQVRHASPIRAFFIRFPWLGATIGSGLTCALLTSFFKPTLSTLIELAFFVPLVLALGESVSIQAMALAVQALRSTRPTFWWLLNQLKRELVTVSFIALGAAVVVGLISLLFAKKVVTAFIVGFGGFMSIIVAGIVGLLLPTGLHALQLDPRVASGPLVLAVTDVLALILYLGFASRWV